MKKNYAGRWAGIGTALAAVIYSVVLLIAKPGMDAAAWILYGFTMMAFLLVGGQMAMASRSGAAMDVVLTVITAAYFGLQLIFGGVVCMAFSSLDVTPVVVCEILLLAAYLIIAFFMYAVQGSHAAQDQTDQQAVRSLRLLEHEMIGMMDEQTDPAVKQALRQLAEEVHFSQAAAMPALAEVEDRIAQQMAVLQEELANDKAQPLARIEAISRLVKERNRAAAILR